MGYPRIFPFYAKIKVIEFSYYDEVLNIELPVIINF